METPCCETMDEQLNYECPTHGTEDCSDFVVVKYEHENGDIWYGIPIRDGSSSALEIEYCPWCGERLAWQKPFGVEHLPFEVRTD